MNKTILQCVTAFGVAAITLANAQPIFAAPVTTGAALNVTAPSHATDVRWWGWGGYYYGPGVYVGPPVYAYPAPYYAPQPAYVAPPVGYTPAPAPVANGPTRQCWISTDDSRGYGYWRAC